MSRNQQGKGMLVLIGGLLVVSFLYFISAMKKDDTTTAEEEEKESQNEKSNKTNTNLQTLSSLDVTNNMECSESSPKFVCSSCGSRTMTIKIEEKIEESTTTTTTIIKDNSNNFVPFNDNLRRVPFAEAGIDIVDRQLKNTKDALEREIDEYCSDGENDILTYVESWTDNWLFRKKKNTDNNNKNDNVTAFKPVSMFVPNTNAKYRALIGDQNVDEISDLSDDNHYSSEEEEEEDATKKWIRGKIEKGMAKYIYEQRSRVFIDGKLKHHIVELNNREALKLTNNTSSSQVVSVDLLDNPNINSHSREADIKEKNMLQVTVSDKFNLTALNDDVTNEKLSNIVEKDRSYCRSELFIETQDVNQNSSLLLSDDELLDTDFNLFSPPKPGTIADREHRKWQTAVPMENNPYSEENLRKRLMEKKYIPKYSSNSSLLGISRISGLDYEKSFVDSTTTTQRQVNMKNDFGKKMNFETIDILPEKPCVSQDNNTPIIESEIVKSDDKSIVTIDLPEKSNISCNNDTPIIIELNKDEIIKCKSSAIGMNQPKESKSKEKDKKEDQTRNKKSVNSKCTNSKAIKVTKKNATRTTTETINEIDYSSADEEKISLPSVKKLVEIFSRIQREIAEPLNKSKDKNISDSEEKFERPKIKRIEKTLQQSPSSPRPLHLHSLTARSLSKEFREGLR